MKLNKYTPKFAALILLFTSFCFMGCLSTLLEQGPRRPSQSARVGLTLQPGEICDYTASGKGVSFDGTKLEMQVSSELL